MPHYKKKIERPITQAEFVEGVNNGYFAKMFHKGFLVFLYYTGCRVQEAIYMKHNDFTLSNSYLYCHIERLKGSTDTPDVVIPLRLPLANEIVRCISFNKESKVWQICRTTGYNIVKRVFPQYYPHFFRLSRITSLLEKRVPLHKIKSFTGINLKNIDYYAGIVDVKEIGEEYLE